MIARSHTAASRPDELPAIAGMTGAYRETAPLAPLRAHFLCAWSSELAPGQSGDVAVLPDGCVDILWVDGRLCVVGPDVVAARPQLASGARVLGLRFQPGAARSWLGVPLSELVGRRVGLDDLWGDRRAGQVAQRLRHCATPDGQMRVLQDALARQAVREYDALAPAASSRRAALLFSSLAASDLAGLGTGEALGLSARSLRRLCLDHFGYGPRCLSASCGCNVSWACCGTRLRRAWLAWRSRPTMPTRRI
ncbi:DUF6597 domain-containing transcriptional factor [Achromobacter sp. UMC71]|uniref:DUF6597 domain-containing transcriptional factor n=1 Tax=Achromobacter sp. UMC71 TaxID=1862320 RepID=UPI0021040903|nr:DUF6597 domain-containing transcriptional factor [Achromobacter sp. UMC71]